MAIALKKLRHLFLCKLQDFLLFLLQAIILKLSLLQNNNNALAKWVKLLTLHKQIAQLKA